MFACSGSIRIGREIIPHAIIAIVLAIGLSRPNDRSRSQTGQQADRSKKTRLIYDEIRAILDAWSRRSKIVKTVNSISGILVFMEKKLSTVLAGSDKEPCQAGAQKTITRKTRSAERKSGTSALAQEQSSRLPGKCKARRARPSIRKDLKKRSKEPRNELFSSILSARYEIRATIATIAPQSGWATEFGAPGDRWAGGNAHFLGRPVNDTDMGVAHRALPGRSRVLVCYGARCAWARVIDRGPYGCDLAKGLEPARGQFCARPRADGSRWCLCKAGREHPGVYRGVLDMTPALRRELRAPRRAWIVYYALDF